MLKRGVGIGLVAWTLLWKNKALGRDRKAAAFAVDEPNRASYGRLFVARVVPIFGRGGEMDGKVASMYPVGFRMQAFDGY